MRKITAFILILLLLITATACGNEKPAGLVSTGTEETVPQAEVTVTEETEEAEEPEAAEEKSHAEQMYEKYYPLLDAIINGYPEDVEKEIKEFQPDDFGPGTPDEDGAVTIELTGENLPDYFAIGNYLCGYSDMVEYSDGHCWVRYSDLYLLFPDYMVDTERTDAVVTVSYTQTEYVDRAGTLEIDLDMWTFSGADEKQSFERCYSYPAGDVIPVYAESFDELQSRVLVCSEPVFEAQGTLVLIRK